VSDGHVLNSRVCTSPLIQRIHVDDTRLMPNKYRHIGIVISDGFVFFIVVVGPVVGRYAIDVADNWRYIYYGGLNPKVFVPPIWLLKVLCRFYCRDNFFDFLVPPVSSASAPQGRALERRLGRFGLYWCPSCHAWCSAYSRWHYIHSESEKLWEVLELI
jgi:hypothetical protein